MNALVYIDNKKVPLILCLILCGNRIPRINFNTLELCETETLSKYLYLQSS